MSAGGQPGGLYEWKGKLIAGDPMKNSLTESWSATDRGLKTEQFGFGTGDYYDRDPFTERATLEGKDREDKIRRTQKALAEAMNYAHTRGIKVCLGFGIGDDPTTKEYEERLEAMIASLLKNYPMLDYIWFFQEEAQGLPGFGWKPAKGSAQEKFVAANSEPFKYLGPPERVAEGVRLNHVCRLVHRIVKKHRQDLPIIINGWGGDCWDRCTDFYLGLDKTLPKDVIFGCQDNTFPQAEPNVSKGLWPASRGVRSLADPVVEQRQLQPLGSAVQRSTFRPHLPGRVQEEVPGNAGDSLAHARVEEVAAYQGQFA